MLKTMIFFNIDFVQVRPRFWRVLGLQLGAKLAILASKLQGGCSPRAFLRYMSFKNGVLEGSGLDFGGPGPRFWRVLGTIFRNFRPFLGSFLRSGRFTDKMRRMPKKPRTLRTPSLHKSFPSVPWAKCGWAAVSPPGGLQLNPPPHRGRAC